MQQRAEAKDSLDDFPTPPWATRALIEALRNLGYLTEPTHLSVREPAANRGSMVRPLAEVFGTVLASDVADYGAGYPLDDFLFPGPLEPVDWTITNPPFRLAEAFVRRALETSRIGCAVLVRTSFIEGQERYEGLFRQCRPQLALQFTERVVMHKGVLLNPDIPVPHIDKDGNEIMRKPSTATSYCWLAWHKPTAEVEPGLTRLEWTGICRARLTKRLDYTVR